MFLELVHEIDGIRVVAVEVLRGLDRVEGRLKVADLVGQKPEIKLNGMKRSDKITRRGVGRQEAFIGLSEDLPRKS